jgi:hypothetical protein
MALAHDHLDLFLAGAAPGGRAYNWQQVLGALQAVGEQQCNESEAVLRKVAVYEGDYLLDEGAGLPHAMSPEDLLRSLAVQTLAAWDLERHRDVITRAAELAESDNLAALARRYLA